MSKYIITCYNVRDFLTNPTKQFYIDAENWVEAQTKILLLDIPEDVIEIQFVKVT